MRRKQLNIWLAIVSVISVVLIVGCSGTPATEEYDPLADGGDQAIDLRQQRFKTNRWPSSFQIPVVVVMARIEKVGQVPH